MNENIKTLRMLAAIWGCCYYEDREFETIWQESIYDSSHFSLVNVADNGAYSTQVEGLISRYAMHICKSIPANDLPVTKEVQDFKWKIKRSDWSSSQVSENDWEMLRIGLYEAFYNEGRGFFAYDLKFADLAINYMKEHDVVVASSCNKLPEE